MLVLTRAKDESIIIGDNIEITVVDIRGDKVRLGVNAPNHVPVHRKEVYDAILKEKQAAAAEEEALKSGRVPHPVPHPVLGRKLTPPQGDDDTDG